MLIIRDERPLCFSASAHYCGNFAVWNVRSLDREAMERFNYCDDCKQKMLTGLFSGYRKCESYTVDEFIPI